jgi:hypothetical protein
MNQTKKCTKCGQEKPATTEFFTKHPACKFGVNSKCKDCERLRYVKNKDKIKEQNLKRKDQRSENFSKWSKANREKRNEYQRIRRQQPEHAIRNNLASRMSQAVSRGFKSAKTESLIGCSFNELKSYLEKQFTEGMNWENYGLHGWHVDHIRPCCSFDLTDPEQQRECFHYTNLQPLWAEDNLSKGGR